MQARVQRLVSVVKMATVRVCTTEEQCSVVRFSWTGGQNVTDIHKGMLPIYGGKCLSRNTVPNWVEKFSEGRSKVADDARSGCPVDIATETTVQRDSREDFCAAGFDALVKRWDKCINVDGGYVEK
jgi:transposase